VHRGAALTPHPIGVRVRPALASDREFIIGVVPRLRAFGTPPLRPPEALDGAERRALEEALASPREDATLLVAELDGLGPAGVAFAQSAVDYFTDETHAHLDILAVAESGEGRGVGRALIEAVERWATGRGYRFIDLNVFAGNARARAVYERAGYAPDIVRYYKELRTDGP
jgi:GNAT superfamily N-acetyltransferase